MAEKKIPIADATLAQLKIYAENTLGIKMAHNAGQALVMSKIRAAQPTITMIEIDEEDEEPQRVLHSSSDHDAELGEEPSRRNVVVGGLKATTSKSDPIVVMLIPEEDKEGGKRPKEVLVNGSCMLIPRGQLVEVPYRFYFALKSAVMSVYHKDQQTQQLVESKVPTVPFQVHQMPPLAEVKKWLRELDAAETKAREDAEEADDLRFARRGARRTG